MARPTKDNVEYFPHYTNARTGRTLFILERKYGNDGYAAWFKILELLGESPGHYFRYGNPVDWMFLVTVMRVDEKIAVEMLQLMADVGAIDAELHAEKCLWSDNFVDGLRPVYSKRKQELPVRPSFRAGNPSKEKLSAHSVPETSQRKGKKSKGKERESTTYSCPELSEPDTPEPVEEHVTPSAELSPPQCPHQEIVDLYHETLPELPRVIEWNEPRQKMLRTRWKEKAERQNLDWWRWYFTEVVSPSDFLMGRSNGFQVDLEWIIRPKNMPKILEGKYRNREPASRQAGLSAVEQRNQANAEEAARMIRESYGEA